MTITDPVTAAKQIKAVLEKRVKGNVDVMFCGYYDFQVYVTFRRIDFAISAVFSFKELMRLRTTEKIADHICYLLKEHIVSNFFFSGDEYER